MQQMEKRRSD